MQKEFKRMKKETSFKIQESMKTTGTRIGATLEKAEASVMLAAFKAISTCTSLALDRFNPNSKATNN
jgi:hypothetical protein